MARLGPEKLCTDRLSGQTELYDLAKDPAEREDLAAKQPERVATLSQALERHVAAGGSPQESGGELSAEQVQMLKSLGYLEESREEEPKH
jgi:hypothetical protein